MQIASIAFKAPSRIVTNDEILEMIRAHSASSFQGDMEKLLHEVKFFLDKSGLVHRHWLNSTEQPIQLLTAAIHDAIEKAGIGPSDPDLVIYAGVDRGFFEPGDSYFIAHALGFRSTRCFDIIDACNSWIRAMYLASSLLKAGEAECVLIVNAEFSMRENGYINPHSFRINKTSDLHFLFPAYTLGEGATATVVRANKDQLDDNQFHFSSRPDLAELCVMPAAGFEGRCHATGKMAECQPLRFSSFGADLFKEAIPEMQKLVRIASVDLDSIKAIFTHAATHQPWVKGFSAFGLADKLLSIYPEYGNIAAASIPAAMALAMQRENIKRGDSVLAAVASAGMSFSLCKFTI